MTDQPPMGLKEQIANYLAYAFPSIAEEDDDFSDEAQGVLDAISAAGRVIVPREPTGEMWAAGRSTFVVYANRVAGASTTVEAMAHEDVSPAQIFRAMCQVAPEVG